MTIGVYDTHQMMRVVETLPSPSTYWLDLCFPMVQTFDSEYIDFDVVDRGRRLAPFVAPTAQGKVMSDRGYATRRFKPAYVKPKAVVDPSRIVKRRAGEPYTGTMSLKAREDAIVADILQEHKDMHTRRREWMACEAIVKGSVTVAGEDYPTQVISFGRDNNNTVTLLTTDKWSDYTNSDPIDDLQTWSIQVQRKSGFAVTRVTMGLDAWAAFKNHPKVKDQLDVLVRGSTDSLFRSALDGSPAQFVGTVGRNLQVWVYNDIYEDETGTQVDFLDSKKVVLTSAGVEGVRCYGAILDRGAGYQATEWFPKMWEEEDPSVLYLMTQSAPLMVPTRPNATLTATVL